MAALYYTRWTESVTERILAAITRVGTVSTMATGNVAGLVSIAPLGPGRSIAAALGSRLPTGQELVRANFAASERILSAQQQYAVRLLEAIRGPRAPRLTTETPTADAHADQRL